MKVKIFDVVELNNGNKATILSENNEPYKAEIVTDDGKSKGIVDLKEENIKKVIFKK